MSTVESILTISAGHVTLSIVWTYVCRRSLGVTSAPLLTLSSAFVPSIVTIAVGYAWLLLLPEHEQAGGGMLLAMTIYIGFLLIPLSLITGAVTFYLLDRRSDTPR